MASSIVIDGWLADADNHGIPTPQEAAALVARCPLTQAEAEAITPPWARLFFFLQGIALDEFNACGACLVGDRPVSIADAPPGRWLGFVAADAASPAELLASAPVDVSGFVRERLAAMDAGMGSLADARLMYAYLLGGVQ